MFTHSPEKVDVICGRITKVIKSAYPTTPIVTLDGKEPTIEDDASKDADLPPSAKTIDQMTVDELVSYVDAAGYEITGFSGMNKADKVAAIKAHEQQIIDSASDWT